MAVIIGTVRNEQYEYLIISRLITLRMRYVSDKRSGENQNTRFAFINFP